MGMGVGCGNKKRCLVPRPLGLVKLSSPYFDVPSISSQESQVPAPRKSLDQQKTKKSRHQPQCQVSIAPFPQYHLVFIM